MKVVVDHRIWLTSKKTVVFARKSQNGAWWVPIMEKAAAKFYGTFENLDAGTGNEAVYALTGMPSCTIDFSDYAEARAFDLITYYNSMNYIMYSGTPDKTDLGIASNHAYTTIDTATYKGEKLVKLRNPWGREQFNGPWSDKDTARWTSDAKAKLGHSSAYDGTFWMKFTDFHRIFEFTEIGMYYNW